MVKIIRGHSTACSISTHVSHLCNIFYIRNVFLDLRSNDNT